MMLTAMMNVFFFHRSPKEFSADRNFARARLGDTREIKTAE